MNRIMTTVAAATATIGVACALPAPASANPVILAPAIAALWLGGAVVGGVAVGAIISHPRGGVLVTSDVPPPAPAPGPEGAGSGPWAGRLGRARPASRLLPEPRENPRRLARHPDLRLIDGA